MTVLRSVRDLIMTQDEFHDFAKFAFRRAVSTLGHIGFLRLTQSYRGKRKVREPELCQSLVQEAEHQQRFYGLEVPTDHPYSFSGDRKRRALHDFALFEPEEGSRPLVRIELKEGSPSRRKDDTGQIVDIPTLSKDLLKLLHEPSKEGRAVLHVVQAADAGTLPSLVQKYSLALQVALAELRGDVASLRDAIGTTWFSVMILAVRLRRARQEVRPALWHVPVDLEELAEQDGQIQLRVGEPDLL
jgi:hypothetical protein